MTKKRRSLFIVFAVICACVLSCTFVLTGCGNKHKFNDDWTSDATYHWHQCTKHDDDSDDVEDKASHTFEDVDVATAATCTENGVMNTKCSVCGYESTRVIEAAHTWGNWTTKTAADCGKDEVQERTCSVCGETEEQTVTGTATGNHTFTITDAEKDITWKWATDYSSATATVTCGVCENDVEIKAEVTSSSDETGTTYTATVEINGVSYTATEFVEAGQSGSGETKEFNLPIEIDFDDPDSYDGFITVGADGKIASGTYTAGILSFISKSDDSSNIDVKEFEDGTTRSALVPNGKSDSSNCYFVIDFSAYGGKTVKIEVEFAANADAPDGRSLYVGTKNVATSGNDQYLIQETKTTSTSETDVKTLTYETTIADGGTKLYLLSDLSLCYYSIKISVVEDAGSGNTHVHSYGDAVVDWTTLDTTDPTKMTVKVTYTCTANDCDESEGYTVVIEAAVTSVATAATCLVDGYTTYTATWSQDNFSDTATYTVTDTGSAKGHSYEVTFGAWTADETYGYAPSVTVTCANDSSEAFDADDYTLTVVKNGNVYTATVAIGSVTGSNTFYGPTEISVTNGAVELNGVSTWANSDSLYIAETQVDSDGNVTYVLGGAASFMDEYEGAAFWSGHSAEGDAYIVLTVTFQEDETVSWVSSAGDTRERTVSDYSTATFDIVVRISGNDLSTEIAAGTFSFTITKTGEETGVTYTVDFSEVVTDEDEAKAQAEAETRVTATVDYIQDFNGASFQNETDVSFVFDHTQSGSDRNTEYDWVWMEAEGTASAMTAAQATAFATESAKAHDSYVLITVTIYAGEKLQYNSGSSTIDNTNGTTDIVETFVFHISYFDDNHGFQFKIFADAQDTVGTMYVITFTEMTPAPVVHTAEPEAVYVDGAWYTVCTECGETFGEALTVGTGYTFTVTSEDELDSAAALDGAEIVLGADITVSDTITVSATVSLDLAGYSVTSAGTTITVVSTGDLTIRDTSAEETGKIETTYANGVSNDYKAAIATTGTLDIESGSIVSSSMGILAEGGVTTIEGGSVSSDYVSIFEGAGTVTVNITGGKVSGTRKGIAVSGDSAFGYWDNGTKQYQDGAVTTLNVSGGYITCTDDSPICTLGEANYTSAIINITGGVIYRADTDNGTPMPAIYAPSATLTISGGTIVGPTAVEIRGGHVTISGGTFISNAHGNSSDSNNGDKDGAKTYGYAVAVYPYGRVTRDGAHTDDTVTGVLVTENEVVVSITGGTFTGAIYVRATSERANWQYADDYSVTVATDTLGLVGTSYDADGDVTTDAEEIVYTLYEAGPSSEEGCDDEKNDDAEEAEFVYDFTNPSC